MSTCRPGWDRRLQKIASLAVSGLLILWGVTLPASKAFAASAATAVAPTNSVIDFGSFAVLPSCSNCSVTISPAGARSATGGIVLTRANPGHAATYSVTESGGCACKPYTAAFTPTSVAATAGAVVMTLGSFTTSQSAASPPNTLSVGATLTIASRGAAGTFSPWSFTITTTP
jgi:hypothetical protein